jgi:hypothetical protein
MEVPPRPDLHRGSDGRRRGRRTADGGPVLSLPALIVAPEESGYLATQDRVDGRLRVVLAV